MPERIRPLVAGISQYDCERVVEALTRGGIKADVTSVGDRDELCRVFRLDRWDVLLIDDSLWATSHELLRQTMREHGVALPIVAVSNSLDEGLLATCGEGGLSDCLTWDDLPRLAFVLQRELHEATERSRRRTLELQLADSERRFRSLVQNMHEGVWIVDPDGITTFVNGRLARMLEYSPGEMVGRPVFDFIAPSRLEAARKQFGQVLRSKPATTETRFLTKSGDTVEVLIRTVPMFDENGDLEYGFATTQDITERRQLRRQVRQAQKMEAIGQLAGGVAHDFNNVLTVINGNSHLLTAQEDLSSRGEQLLAQIRNASDSAADLTRQLLTFGRKQEMQLEPLDLGEVVEETTPMLRRMIREDIELDVVAADGLHPTVADRTQIDQVLMNLAVNARDAMPDGGVLTIEVDNASLDADYAASHADVEPGDYVRLSVADTGIGMDQETQERIFEPFFTTKQDSGGTGLGLATCYGIVRQMNGWIYCYSEPGEGTVFKVYFPAAEGAGAQVSGDEQGQAEDLTGDETILLVEDDEQVRKYTLAALQEYGYTVLEAEDGARALAMLADEPDVALIVTDVVMPELGGGELAEEADKVRPDVEILYVSGYNGSALSRTGLEPDSAHFLQKPFTPTDLAETVRGILDRE